MVLYLQHRVLGRTKEIINGRSFAMLGPAGAVTAGDKGALFCY